VTCIRGLLSIAVFLFVCGLPLRVHAAGEAPMGILTRASGAQLNSAEAYPGLSVFEGESLSTAADGKLGVRVGAVTLALSQGAQATLQKVAKGTHVDIERRSFVLRFSTRYLGGSAHSGSLAAAGEQSIDTSGSAHAGTKSAPDRGNAWKSGIGVSRRISIDPGGRNLPDLPGCSSGVGESREVGSASRGDQDQDGDLYSFWTGRDRRRGVGSSRTDRIQ
jgi:hypothetical protein